MQKRTNKLDKVLNEKYEESSSRFDDEFNNAKTVEDQLFAYARYVGRLEGLLEGLTVGVK